MGKELQSSFSPRDGAPGSKWSSYMPCRELSEELALAAHRSPDRGLAWSEPKAQNMGSNGTFKTPENNQSDTFDPDRQEKNGRIKEFVRRGLGAAAAIAVAVGGMFGVGHAAEVVKANTTEVTCQEFEIGSPESVPGMPGTVVMNKEDQRRVGGFFKEVGGDASAASMTSPQPVDVFRGGATTVCVRTNAIDGVSDVSVTHTGK